ncbi:hypothetical protein OAN33_02240 [Flavobacteriales bacterium]|nr:hypothetical protein [Flavobacteriales bacterium]
MKQFAIKIFVVFGLFLSYNIIIYIINLWFINAAEFPEKNILIIGDSQFKTGLNDEMFNSAWNIAQSAEPIPISYWKLKKIAEATKIDTILISISHQRLSFFNDSKFVRDKYKNEFFKRMYPLQIDFRNSNVKIDQFDYFKIVYQQMCLFPKSKHNTYIGEFSKSTNNNASLKKPYDFSKLDSRISQHFFINNKTPYEVSKVSLSYIDSIISFAKFRKITPVFIALPVHKTYLKRVPERILKQFKSLALKFETSGVDFLDYSDLKIADSLFLDYDHINKTGSKIMTKQIIKDLKINK